MLGYNIRLHLQAAHSYQNLPHLGVVNSTGLQTVQPHYSIGGNEEIKFDHIYDVSMTYVHAVDRGCAKMFRQWLSKDSMILLFNSRIQIESPNHSASAPLLTEYFCATSIHGMDVRH